VSRQYLLNGDSMSDARVCSKCSMVASEYDTECGWCGAILPALPPKPIEPWMECGKCGEWQIKHEGTCPHCGAPNSTLIVRIDDGKEDVTGVFARLTKGSSSAA
jgi:RNA polymerase subunit RPABC4/transcription elongation factor Spt4